MILRFLLAASCLTMSISLVAQANRPWDPAWRASHVNRTLLLKTDSVRYRIPEADFSATLLTRTGDTLRFEELLRANRGRVIVVDLWSTACPPCIKVLPIMMDMEQRMKKYPVTFVYLHMGRRTDDWRKYTSSGPLSEVDYNLYISDYASSALKQTLAINSVPRYLVFDRQGRLCDAYAPKPGKGLESHVWRLIDDL